MTMILKLPGSEDHHTYTYDAAGNNELQQDSGIRYIGGTPLADAIPLTTYEYDVNGNRVQKEVNNGSVPTDITTYTWDVSNRLSSADTNNDGTADFTAVYDYRTRRVKKTESGSSTRFRYDGGVAFDELNDATGAVTVSFTRGGGMGGGIGSILYSVRGTTEEYFTNNAVGHTVALTDGAGAVTKTDLYEAFGQIQHHTGASDNNRLANTKERDASTDLDNHGFRYYDQYIGRYISRDPIGFADGMNPHIYVHNNPINHIDPEGLADERVNTLKEKRKALAGQLRKTQNEEERGRLAKEITVVNQKLADLADNPKFGENYSPGDVCFTYASNRKYVRTPDIGKWKENYKIDVRPSAKDEASPEGYHKIYVVVGDRDVHFYRQDNTGEWSGVLGDEAPGPTNKGPDGTVIVDPSSISHDYRKVGGLNYDKKIGYYVINTNPNEEERKVIERFKPAIKQIELNEQVLRTQMGIHNAGGEDTSNLEADLKKLEKELADVNARIEEQKEAGTYPTDKEFREFFYGQ